jgi:hypothetical protein
VTMHLHLARSLVGWGLGILVMAPLFLPFVGETRRKRLASVTGQVTYSGRPLGDMMICLDSGGAHSAYGAVKPDGSFILSDLVLGSAGALPGRYHAHLFKRSPESPSLPSKYADPRTSGLDVEIGSAWSHFKIDLQ